MSQLSESGHAQNQDMKGKFYENGFSTPAIPTQRESLHDSNTTTTTTTPFWSYSFHALNFSPASCLKEKHSSADRLVLQSWLGRDSQEEGSLNNPSTEKHTSSLFLISPPVAALIRLLLQWWGWFIYLFFEGHWEEPWRRQWHPTPVLLPGESHGQRSLVGCSPWGR